MKKDYSKLTEATALAIQGKLTENKRLRHKLDEVYIMDDLGFGELYDTSWGQAKLVLDEIESAGKEDELMNYLDEFGTEDAPIDRTELNNMLAFEWEDIYDALGLDENGNVKEDLDEAKNPENDEINTKIRKTLNGSTKYKDDLKDAGLETVEDEKGKVTTVRNPNKNSAGYKGMNKQDLKNSHPDTDYYNYLTKSKEEPVETDTGAFTYDNIFRNSDNFEKTAGSRDVNRLRTDKNGVSTAIPKKYKTGNKNYNVDLDKFPRKSYNGVASYEPLSNTELDDFKYDKSRVSDDGTLKRDLDDAKEKYDDVKAQYDTVNDRVTDVRNRIAKSKERTNQKTESVKLQEVDATSDFLNDLKDLFNKHLRLPTITDIGLESNDGVDIITIVFNDGVKSKINVTGDSNISIIKDILNKIG